MIKLSEAKKLLNECGYTITRNIEYDTHKLPFDYKDKKECSIRHYGDVLTESLYFYSEEKFIKQMKLVIPNFTDYIKNRVHTDLILKPEIKDLFNSKKEFEALLDKYCYRLRNDNYLSVVIGPEYNLDKDNKNYYIHISPVPNLNEIGIEPRSSGKFEEYSPRIYLFKLNDLVGYDIEMKDMAEDLYYSCQDIIDMFNSAYGENKTYYVYLCKLDDDRDIFIDNVMTDWKAYYTFKKIVPSRIKKL